MQLEQGAPLRSKRRNAFAHRQLREHEYRELIIAAYQYGFPIFEHARLVYNFSYAATNPRRVPINRFAHARSLTGVAEQKVTTPNHDTLYSSAIIDLSGGPVWLDVPDFSDRYYSITLFDAFTNVFHCIGSRLHKAGATSYLMASPDWKDNKQNTPLLRAPCDQVVALVRIHAATPRDYPQVHALQDELILRPTGTPSDRAVTAPVPTDPINFVAVVNQVLRETPLPYADFDLLEQLSRVGIGPQALELSDHLADLWRINYPLARARLQHISTSFGRMVTGWEYPPSTIGDFGTDYVARAVIGLKGLWANIPAEQTYSLALADQDGEALSGENSYRLILPKTGIEDCALWSLSMYARTALGQLVFFHNEIDRYAINGNTPGLRWNVDGSLEIAISQTRPADGNANWLPSPSGQFVMVMRVYAPKRDEIGKSVFYPPVVRQKETALPGAAVQFSLT